MARDSLTQRCDSDCENRQRIVGFSKTVLLQPLNGNLVAFISVRARSSAQKIPRNHKKFR